MIILIGGASHTGKTLLAQRLMEQLHIPYLSIDHLKMGLIRSGMITLDAYSEEEQLTACLWPIVREMIKTAIENRQQLIVEGCYIPVRWQEDFSAAYLQAIRSVWLLMSDAYICDRFDEILAHADIIEQRKADDCTMAELREDNARLRRLCALYALPHVLIDGQYPEDILAAAQKEIR